MVDQKQIKQWLNDGTITEAQAKKMLADNYREKSEEKSNKFISTVAIIGAVLIFVGIAWLIAKNWHQIPDAMKVIILVFATLASFISGVSLRQNEHEGIGRSLITLGALLYILSLFLVSQIYHLATTTQHYAWLLFLAWTLILITAYLVDSLENLIVSILVFFPWVILQYIASISRTEEGIIVGFILIFLSAGALLYGLSILHKSVKHPFTNIYRLWTAFYFLLIFYILSFQSILPILSNYSFEAGSFSVFLILFIGVCFFGFMIGTIFATSKSSSSIEEIAVFIGILAIIFTLILSTGAGTGLVGNCYPKTCYDFKTSSDCTSAPSPLICKWETNQAKSYCIEMNCYILKTETECNSVSDKLTCKWQNDYCEQQRLEENTAYKTCSKYNNQRDNCRSKSLCKWQQSYNFWSASRGLPTSLWFLWIVNNVVFIGFIVLILWYGQKVGSAEIVNLALLAFVVEIITRYIGFWLNFKGYFAFSILAILGGLMLILGAWLIPKWRRSLLEKIEFDR